MLFASFLLLLPVFVLRSSLFLPVVCNSSLWCQIRSGSTMPGSKSSVDSLIIKIPNSRVLRVIARSVLLMFTILSIPWIQSIFHSNKAVVRSNHSPTLNLKNLFRDLENEGLLISGSRVLVLDDKVDVNLISPQFDLAFARRDFGRIEDFVDKMLKIGGIIAIEVGDYAEILPFYNYDIVYLRRFESTVVAMRKTGSDGGGKRRLCGLIAAEKKAALKKLEDVLLEPPRSASRKSHRYMKRTKYLPDLMGDSLEGYSRRVFIDVGSGGGRDWFLRNYPRKKEEFEIYEVEAVVGLSEMDVSEWLRRNVKEEEYVVMKAEVEVVEEMAMSDAIRLVDELFYDCRPRPNRRAYWQCLALHGLLRDKGVAVHQWWG